jgi:hypothetical protein
MLSIPEIVEAVSADLAARGVTATVQFGGWKVTYLTGGNRVVFSLEDFEADGPGEPNAPGVQYITPDNTTGARALFTRVQSVKVWVHGAAPDARDPKRSENAEKATAALLHVTLGAIYRVAHGSFGWGAGKWPSDGRQDFVHGSLATFIAQFSIPVLDDEMQGIQPDGEGSTSTMVAELAAGDVTDSVTPAP